MHRVLMNYARSISDEKKVKTIVKGNKSGEITGSSDVSGINGRFVWPQNKVIWKW